MIWRLLLVLALLAPAAARADQAWRAGYPEGPVWIDGRLYWAEMTMDVVKVWTGGEPEVAFHREGCGPTALARYREAEFIVLCHHEGALVRLDAEMRLISVIRATADGVLLRDPNDVSADRKGGVWFSDPGLFSPHAPYEGAIYYLSAEGVLTRHVTGLGYSNGVFVDEANGRLLVSEHRGRKVLSYPLTETGLGEPQVMFRLDDFGLQPSGYDLAGPDGLEIDAGGTLWVAEYGAARLIGWREDKGMVAAIRVELPYLTNIAFGPDGLAALTGAENNRIHPYPGVVWVFDAKVLEKLRTD